LGEKPLHAALKRWYAEPGDRIEVPVQGYVIDLVRDDLLIEIQTRNFSAMSRKLAALVENHPVRIVHPVAVERWIVKVGADGAETGRRKSPKRGSVYDLFAELVSFPELVAADGFSIEVLLTQEEELRRFDGTKAWRRKGWVVEERRLIEVLEWVLIERPADLVALLPADLPDAFTTADIATALGKPRRLAQQMTYCLRRLGVIDMVEKRGNALVYEVA
jgi:hypothetical protein